MNTDLKLLQDVKVMSTKIRGDEDSGKSYLMGYIWASLTQKQQKEIAKSFREQLAEASEL
jgi:polynucleotide 5'-kinase involved in rRNA processing